MNGSASQAAVNIHIVPVGFGSGRCDQFFDGQEEKGELDSICPAGRRSRRRCSVAGTDFTL